MKARITQTYKLSKKCTEKVKEIFKEYEGQYHININLYAIDEVSQEAEKLSNKAKSDMDSAMKGWKPVAEGTEIGWQIHNALGIINRSEEDYLIEVTYDRSYIK